MTFPLHRPRRLRRSEALRRMVRETRLTVDNLIYPLFVCPGEHVRKPINSMPGCFQLSIDELIKEAREVFLLEIPAVILFGIPSKKDDVGSEACDVNGIVARAIRGLKSQVPKLQVWADVCLCEYTDHGHCGIVRNNEVDNDATIALLAREAVVYAHAGADVIAPSDMMDGRVGKIRDALDEAGYSHVKILSYAAKYASAFYGPFRDAVGSAGNLGKADKKTYQMDPANSDEALREVALDIAEGADMVMIKPGMPYLDIIRRVKDNFAVPIFAYQVSGEYAMLKAAAEKGFLDERAAMRESLLAFRRAGASAVFTYGAKVVAGWLAEEKG